MLVFGASVDVRKWCTIEGDPNLIGVLLRGTRTQTSVDDWLNATLRPLNMVHDRLMLVPLLYEDFALSDPVQVLNLITNLVVSNSSYHNADKLLLWGLVKCHAIVLARCQTRLGVTNRRKILPVSRMHEQACCELAVKFNLAIALIRYLGQDRRGKCSW